MAFIQSFNKCSLSIIDALNKFLLLHLIQQSKNGFGLSFYKYLSSVTKTTSGFHLPFLNSVGLFFSFGTLTFYSFPPATFLFLTTYSEFSSLCDDSSS